MTNEHPNAITTDQVSAWAGVPVYVGAWSWPEARFYMQTTAKPRAIHRLMMRWFFGIRWLDGANPWADAALSRSET